MVDQGISLKIKQKYSSATTEPNRPFSFWHPILAIGWHFCFLLGNNMFHQTVEIHFLNIKTIYAILKSFATS